MREVRLADVGEEDFLAELEPLDRRVTAHADAGPAAQEEGARHKIGMQRRAGIGVAGRGHLPRALVELDDDDDCEAADEQRDDDQQPDGQQFEHPGSVGLIDH